MLNYEFPPLGGGGGVIFSHIADSMAKDDADDGSGELRCWWKLAVLSKTVGKTSESLYYCYKVIELGKRKSVHERQYIRIEKAQNMIDEITGEQ